MAKKCNCKLPYVLTGSKFCEICKKKQITFNILDTERQITKVTKFNGFEFKPGDVIEVIGKSYSCLVEVQKYISQGWYLVKLPNGGYHETQILGTKVC